MTNIIINLITEELLTYFLDKIWTRYFFSFFISIFFDNTSRYQMGNKLFIVSYVKEFNVKVRLEIFEYLLVY